MKGDEVQAAALYVCEGGGPTGDEVKAAALCVDVGVVGLEVAVSTTLQYWVPPLTGEGGRGKKEVLRGGPLFPQCLGAGESICMELCTSHRAFITVPIPAQWPAAPPRTAVAGNTPQVHHPLPLHAGRGGGREEKKGISGQRSPAGGGICRHLCEGQHNVLHM